MGLGAAASEPGTLSIIRHVYPDEGTRADALGVWAAVSGLALALGPVIGGVLVGLWSWRAIFWFNLVIGAVALVMASLFVPETADREGHPRLAGDRPGCPGAGDRLLRHHPGGAVRLPGRGGSTLFFALVGRLRRSPSSSSSTGRGVPSSTSRSSAGGRSRVRSSSPLPRTSGPSPSSSSPPCTSRWSSTLPPTPPRSRSSPWPPG